MKPQLVAFTATLLCLLAAPAEAYYTVLQESYTPSNFFSKFNFYTAYPTHGFVQYLSKADAAARGMIRTFPDAVYIGVDNTTANAFSGRASVRLESMATFQRGLIILDLEHMPGGICGTWPAFWTLGDDWPNNGEIDIIEGVHDNAVNSMALHTSAGCTITGAGGTGSLTTSNCDVNAAGQGPNQGCAISATCTNSYGDGFNANGSGGIYATEWNSAFIKIWYFPRGSVIPADVLGPNPAPETWGPPVGMFQGACNIDQKFRKHRIIINTTFCGDWAGNVWSDHPNCLAKEPTCNAFVQNHPEAFADAYWRIKSLRVFSS
ncbi:mixed-linked glucanase [Sphaerosporella brunnea]|uniref:endo-1,3(4)-beta-glucanase n=1 Tax=Sphaerosporella brunnea TaxID=1250544 RepID=A0A5J5EC28_9PEZI|nr:mixed-linked glucanase [Sphaerosporella brunnea]